MDGIASYLAKELWDRLLSVGTPRSYPPGRSLMRQGEPADKVIALIRGRVRVSLVDEDGNDVLLSVRSDGELIGEMAFFGDRRRSATVTTIDRCDTRVLSATQFNLFVQENDLQQRLLRHFVSRLKEGERIRAELASLPARPRIIRWLLRASRSPAARPMAGSTAVDIGVAQADLVRAVGLARSTVADEVAWLKTQGAVLRTRAPMVVEQGRLAQLLTQPPPD